MVHAGCTFVAGIHPSRAWVLGSLKSVRWNVCRHRLDLSLYSHPKELWVNGVRTHVSSQGKNPSPGEILLRGGSNPRLHAGQHQAGQRAQHITKWAIPAPEGGSEQTCHLRVLQNQSVYLLLSFIKRNSSVIYPVNILYWGQVAKKLKTYTSIMQTSLFLKFSVKER